MSTGEDLRGVMRSFPHGVAVVTVDAGGQRVGLTVSTLVALSLEPPLVGFALSGQAALHELLREAGTCVVNLLAGDQDAIARHFARGVPPLVMWEGIEVLPGRAGAPLLAGSLGWLECRLADSIAAGSHTFFTCAVERAVPGTGASPLVHVGQEVRAL